MVSNKSYNKLGPVEELLRGVIEEGEIYMNRPEASFCSISLRSESEKHDMFGNIFLMQMTI